jgi:hypothetical protein
MAKGDVAGPEHPFPSKETASIRTANFRDYFIILLTNGCLLRGLIRWLPCPPVRRSGDSFQMCEEEENKRRNSSPGSLIISNSQPEEIRFFR